MKADPDKTLAENVIFLIERLWKSGREPRHWEADLVRQAKQEIEDADSNRTD